MYPNFAEILKPWPILKSNVLPGPGRSDRLGVRCRQVPADYPQRDILGEFTRNPQSILLRIYDAKVSAEVTVARLLVSWEISPDYFLTPASLQRISEDLVPFLQGQLLALDLDHLRIGSVDIYNNISPQGHSANTFVIAHSNFERGYSAMKHGDDRQWKLPYQLRSREKTAPKSAEIDRPPVREPLDY